MTVKSPKPKTSAAVEEKLRACLEQLHLLRGFAGDAQAFWSRYLTLLAELCEAKKAVIVTCASNHPGLGRLSRRGDRQASSCLPTACCNVELT